MSMAQKRTVDLIYYKTNKGLLVANAAMNYGTVRSNLPASALINDKPLKPTYSAVWYFIEGESEILSYKEKEPDTHIISSFQLKDAEMEIEGKIPFSFKPEEVEQYYDEDEELYLWKYHSSLSSLYEPVYSLVPGGYKDVDFSAECKGEVEGDISKPVDTTFRLMHEGSWGKKETVAVEIGKICHYEELDQILTPEFALHTKPCALTSKQTYDIVRTYIKDHIDPKQATITSDYDFCFAVKKKVAIKPWVKSVEIKKNNGRSYATPKFKTQTVDHKLVDLFEMTHDQENYKGYTPIKGFGGENLEILVDRIKSYLQDLIDYINMPVAECQHCNGTGHIIDKGFSMNKRDE